MAQRPFRQVDVFSEVPVGGNPVAVVLDAEGLTDEQMAQFARWTNLSETTFVLPATDPAADYRLRIFTPLRELPFAGHPTLGSAHAWLSTVTEPERDPAEPRELVQQCAAGLITVRVTGDRYAFAAPPRRRTGPLDQATLDRVVAALRLTPADIVDHQWVDNGPGWLAVLLESGARVRAVEPDFPIMRDLDVGVVGPQRDGEDTDVEVRAFAPGMASGEDPVTGSLNASLAQWLRETGRIPDHYLAAQGTVVGRTGRVYIDDDGTHIWVGGRCASLITGTVDV